MDDTRDLGARVRSAGVLGSAGRIALGVILFCTGACALILQVTWQRVIALNSGVDLSATITVVAAYMAGMGLGSLLGGRLADRCDPSSALRALALAKVGLALYVWASIWMLYDLHRSLAASLDSTAAAFGFNTVMLLVPTVIFGMSLPLVARAVTARASQAGSRVGWFAAVNTAGAAFGAWLAGWVLLGSFGFVGVTRTVAVVVLGAAVSLWGLAEVMRRSPRTADDAALGPLLERPYNEPVPLDETTHDPPPSPTRWSTRRWYAIYGLTGAVALGFEQVFFRLIDALMRSNAYTFGHVLALFLALWAIGTAAGSVIVPRVSDHRRWFLWMQFGVGTTALLSLTFFVRVMPRLLPTEFATWFSSGGMTYGMNSVDSADRVLFGFLIPILFMAGPVLLFGAAFPFAEALVSQDLPSIGRATGWLLFASIAGNVVSTLVTGYILIEHLGTAGSVVALSIAVLAAGSMASGSMHRGRAVAVRVAAVGAVVVLIAATPSNQRLWSMLAGSSPDSLTLAEDRSCASALVSDSTGRASLQINGRTQNGYPFTDFHVLLGLLPAIAHPNPERGLAIGFGIGSTSYGMAASARFDDITSVEICGGNFDLAEELAADGAPELAQLLDDDRHHRVVGDGRMHLLANPEEYDVIAPDTLLPQSAGSNSLYSLEFIRLVASRLGDDGILSIWSASERTINSVTASFPHVVRVVGGYVDPTTPSRIILASRSPIVLDVDALLKRFDRIPPSAFSNAQRASLRALLRELDIECFNDGQIPPRPDESDLNRDLRPRDEYFLNNTGITEESVARSCAG